MLIAIDREAIASISCSWGECRKVVAHIEDEFVDSIQPILSLHIRSFGELSRQECQIDCFTKIVYRAEDTIVALSFVGTIFRCGNGDGLGLLVIMDFDGIRLQQFKIPDIDQSLECNLISIERDIRNIVGRG